MILSVYGAGGQARTGGLALVAVVDSSQAVIAATLSILLPLSFISDIFIGVEDMPPVLNTIGWFFPLRRQKPGVRV